MQAVHGTTKYSRFTIKTEQKYVYDIWQASGYNPKESKHYIEVFVVEEEGNKVKSTMFYLSQGADLVYIVPLKHEYSIFVFYTVF